MIQHPELDGPFSVATAWTAQTLNGITFQVPTAFSANHWNTTPHFYAAHPTLIPYLDSTRPLARVWEGDNPASPSSTVALAFPDASTAQTVLLACGAIDTSAITP